MGFMTGPEWIRTAAGLRALVAHRPKGVTIPQAVALALRMGDPEVAWVELHDTLFSDDSALRESERVVRSWLDQDFQIVTVLDDNYPSPLRNVHDAPPFLFYRGDLSIIEADGFSVVGTREITPGGASMAREVVEYLVNAEIPVISGLARGVDQVAHTTTLTRGGTPIGVIATPITGPYTPMATRDLHEEVARRGVLVSQFEPGTRVHKGSFLQRNATMSGLGAGTIIIEASERSGTRAQANNAMDHGRPVILTDWVYNSTNWAKELADGSRPNVKVIQTSDNLASAIGFAQTLENPDLSVILAGLKAS